MKETPVPCSRRNKGKKCGKLPKIINPVEGLYYAVCTCRSHSVAGMYTFVGITPEKAIKAWNDFHDKSKSTRRMRELKEKYDL